MFKLLNKIAWLVSTIFGFILIFLFGILTDSMDGGFINFLDNDMLLFWIIGSIILGMIFKKIFLSESYILTRLEHFAGAIEKILAKKSGKIIKNEVLISVQEVSEEIVDLSQPLTEKIEIKQEYIPEPIQTEELQKNNIPDYLNDYQEGSEPEEPSKVAIYIKKFFAENLLAKIGSILVFLGVVFLMSLIWSQIPSVGKIIIGFAIGFGIYIAGVMLDKKGLSGEARTLLGTGILINFLVILAGKHLVGDNYSDFNTIPSGLLSTGITFLFLILNTVFGVVTSMVYKSRTILLFSFIFAYINPFLTGGSADNPYTLVGYSMIVSLGALFIGTRQNDTLLKYSAFILGNILFLVAPFSTEIGWITKLVASAILGFLTIINFSQTSKKDIPGIFITNYIFIILLLFAGGDNGILEVGTSFISYMISILFFFAIGIWLFIKSTLKSIGVLFIFPVLIVLGLIFSGSIGFIAPTLAIIVLAYLIGFNFLETVLAPAMKYIFFGILGVFIFMVNSYMGINFEILEFSSFITVVIVSFIFLFTSYYLSRKNNLEFLYSIGTIGGILTLLPVLVTTRYIPNGITESTGDTLMRISHNSMFNISIIAIILFAIANWILPFINKNLTKKGSNIKNLLIGSVFGILFIGFQLFNYGDTYFPGVMLGLSFGGLAIVYFILSYLMMNKIGVENVKSEVSSKNTIFSYLFISISLFSLAIAMVFANNPEIVSTVWLFEATILFYFYSKTSENKIFGLGMILFIIGITQLFDLNASKGEFLFLVPFSIIFTSLVYNLKFLDSIKTGAGRVFHDIFHILGIGVLGTLLVDIIPSTGHGWSTIGVSIFVLLLGFIYSRFYSRILKIFFIIILIIFMISQYGSLSYIFSRIDNDNLSYLRILQYATFGIFGSAIVVWNRYNKAFFLNKIINISFVIYTLLIVSSFVLDIFNTTFAVTIFWAIISSILLFYGISSDKIKLRTIGLYLLSLVLGKIFIYDIWYGLDNAITRVVALIVIGILLIIISTRYTKKYGNNLKGEFNFSNLSDNSSDKKSNITKSKNNNDSALNTVSEKIENPSVINTKIQDIDISNINSVKFYPNGDKAFSSKAKNLKKIVKLVLKEQETAVFKKEELEEKYNFIIENYKSDLSKRDFDILNGAIKNFVKKGGKLEIKKTD